MSKSLQPKYRSRSPSQGICRVSTLRRSTLQGLMVVGLIVEEILKMCQSHWSAKYRSRSPGQGTCRVSTSRRSTTQGLVVVRLIVEKIWNVKIVSKSMECKIQVKVTRSRYLPSQYIEKKHFARFDGCRPYTCS